MHGFGPKHDARRYPMRDERFEATVTFDERRGYIASAPELRHPIVALSLASLRKRIEIALLPDDVRVVLHLDGLAERERHRRRATSFGSSGQTWRQPPPKWKSTANAIRPAH